MGRQKHLTRVPNRWEVYSSLGNRIAGTRFICFKTPLKEFYDMKLTTESQRFSPSDLIRMVSEKGEELGLVIDFTFTDRYYDSVDITKKGIEYQKIKTVGSCVPSEETIESFTTVVQKFFEENGDNDKLIGVHCTHGVNITGYIICKYMMDHLNFETEAAIEAFNTARGHDIEREYYLCALRGGTDEEVAELKEKKVEELQVKASKRQQEPKKTPPAKKMDNRPFRGQGQMPNFGDRIRGSGWRGRGDYHSGYPGMGDQGFGYGRQGPGYGPGYRPWGQGFDYPEESFNRQHRHGLGLGPPRSAFHPRGRGFPPGSNSRRQYFGETEEFWQPGPGPLGRQETDMDVSQTRGNFTDFKEVLRAGFEMGLEAAAANNQGFKRRQGRPFGGFNYDDEYW